ncbi:zinc ribbon domain-containing protein [bacterium]|nr:zinc ribbon domain-containing protein [bacterium]
MKENKFCQSCGYPMEKDKKGGGTNTDGTINKMYCSMCYANGKFLTPAHIDTAKKFQKYCVEEIKKDGMNGIMAWLLTRGIPKLERWKK